MVVISDQMRDFLFHWKNTRLADGTIHFYPCTDDIQHELTPSCVCTPDAELVMGDVWMYAHHRTGGENGDK